MENALVRSSSGVVCGSIACSIDRKGPASLPDGLTVPKAAATISKMRFVVVANTTPAAAAGAPSATVANDGQTLSSQSAATQALFTGVWGRSRLAGVGHKHSAATVR